MIWGDKVKAQMGLLSPYKRKYLNKNLNGRITRDHFNESCPFKYFKKLLNLHFNIIKVLKLMRF